MEQDHDVSKTDPGPPETPAESDSVTQKKSEDVASPERGNATSSPQVPYSAPQAPIPTPTSPAAKTHQENTLDMDKQLQESLSEFDRKLLKDRILLEGLQGAQAGEELSGETVGDLSNTGAEGTGAQDSTGEEIQPTASSSENLPETTTSTPGKSEHGSTRPATVPPDIPDGRDDDIVARQIREAAMREKDPELRKKLWEEYRRYKQSSGAYTPRGQRVKNT